MKRLLILLILISYMSADLYAGPWPRRLLTDIDNDLVVIGDDGSLSVQTSTNSATKVSDQEGNVADINLDGTLNVQTSTNSTVKIISNAGNIADVDSNGRLRVQDNGILCASGAFAGCSTINKFGANPNSAQDTLEDIWDGSNLYTYPTVATMTHISQTADQGTMQGGTIEVQGLDINWDLVVQTVDLDGSDTTTAVVLSTPLIRAFRMKVLENVVSTSPIRLHNAAETVDYAIMLSGNNQTLMALYTVPNGYTAYMSHYYVSVTRSSALDPTGTEIRLWARDNVNGYQFQLKHEIGLPSESTPYTQPFYPYYKFTQKTDIKMTALCEDKAGQVHAGFDLILVAN